MSASLAPESGRTGNLFLDTLPAASVARLMPELEAMSMASSAPIAHAGSVLEHVIFPTSGIVSQ